MVPSKRHFLLPLVASNQLRLDLGCGWVFGLIQTEFAAAGQSDGRKKAPWRLLHLGAMDAFGVERSHRRFEIVAHQKQFVLIVFVRGMTSHFCGWKREDQPSVPNID